MFEFLRGTLVKLKRHYHKMVHRKIEYEQYSPKIKDAWIIQKTGKTLILNEIENQFYNIDRTYTYNFPEVKLHHLNDVYLAGKEAWPFLHLNNIFQPAINLYDQSQERIKRPVNFLAKQQTGTIFHLAGPNSGNKGHFLIEHLPRLLSSIEVLNTIPDYSILLLPQRGNAHIPLLNKLEIKPDRYVYASKGTTKCQKVLYSPLLTENRKQYLAPPPGIFRNQKSRNTTY